MLEAQGLTLRRGDGLALDAVDFAVRRGEFVAVIGPNGAGKSSLLGALSGALRPSEGAVRIDGGNPARFGARQLSRKRAVLEQNPEGALGFALIELAQFAIPREIAPAEARRIAESALEAVGLRAMSRRLVRHLSGGERHRGHMARALAQLRAGRALGAGEWLLLDEPTASLDLAHQGAILRAARAAADEGAGVLAVLHDPSLAAAFADRVALMAAGRIVADGAPEAVLTPERLGALYGVPVHIGRAGGALAITPLHQKH